MRLRVPLSRLAEAVAAVMASARRAVPDADIDGVLVSEMARGVELLIGVVNDQSFGPTVALGMGGVLTEILRDVTYRIAPFDREALEHHLLAALERLVDDVHGVDDAGGQLQHDLVEVELADVVGGRRQAVVHLGEDRLLLGGRTTSSFCEKIFRSSRSWTRRPTALSPCRRRRDRCRPSSSRAWPCPGGARTRRRGRAWYSRIRWALPEITRLSVVDPLALERGRARRAGCGGRRRRRCR